MSLYVIEIYDCTHHFCVFFVFMYICIVPRDPGWYILNAEDVLKKTKDFL